MKSKAKAIQPVAIQADTTHIDPRSTCRPPKPVSPRKAEKRIAIRNKVFNSKC